MNRNEKALGIALVVYSLYWAVYLMKGGNFCMPAVQLAEEFIGSLVTLVFFWGVSWILLSPDPDAEELDGLVGNDKVKHVLDLWINSKNCEAFDPYSALAAEKLGVSYMEFMTEISNDTYANHEEYKTARKNAKVEILKFVYGGASE